MMTNTNTNTDAAANLTISQLERVMHTAAGRLNGTMTPESRARYADKLWDIFYFSADAPSPRRAARLNEIRNLAQSHWNLAMSIR